MNKICIFFLKWCGFFYIAIGWWNLTNEQMFDAQVVPLKYQADLDQYKHTIVGSLNSHYLIPFFVAIGLWVFLGALDCWTLLKYWFVKEGNPVELGAVEGLPDYPECFNSMHLDNMIMEEEMI